MQTLSAKQLKKLLDQKKVILIDVREPFEHQAGFIDGAHLMPLAELCCGKLPLTKSKKIVVHCLKGVRGAQAAAKLLQENPQLDVYSLEGGLTAWKEEGYPTQKASCVMIGLERQNQIVAGSLVLLGVLMGDYVHSAFLFLSFFVGAGLIFVGITGSFMMAKLLAKMSWNQF